MDAQSTAAEDGAVVDVSRDTQPVAQRDPADARVDRDLSWLEFNRRVLHEALDERTPLLERVKFLAIFAANLDEFFMKRMALLRTAHGSPRATAEPASMRLREMIGTMLAEASACYAQVVRPRLAAHGVRLADWNELSEAQQAAVSRPFASEISPMLTPLSLDAAHPFPFVSNLSTSWAFRLDDPVAGESVLVRVKVPRELPQWLEAPGEPPELDRVFVSLADVIRGNAQALFPGMTITNASLFRVCRDAEVDLDDDGQSKRLLVERELAQRRFEPVVRVDVQPHADPELLAELRAGLGLTADDIYEMRGLFDFTTLFQIAGLDLPALRDPPWTPLPPVGLEPGGGDIFAAIRARDILLHHPYDSFEASVERFIRDAADDPLTASIKMTVYRVGDDTPFVRSLIRAAEAGKQVACVIELSARFDEERNLHWSRELEQVGAHVVFGVSGLKTHSKAALVVRREEDGPRCYAHVATGNYHARTARQYEDVGLLTADPRITDDVVTLFHFLTGRSRTPSFSTLLVAPLYLRARLLELIEREREHHCAGRPARIIAKMNQLEDAEICAALIRASQVGVPIDLIVRGFCCLAPGVPGLTETISVRSIVGRFLEHSRIFYFAAGHDDPLEGDFLIGSADWMRRNLSARVEACVPVLRRELRARLWDVLGICLADRRSAWEMLPDGGYRQLPADPGDEAAGEMTHSVLIRLARARNAVYTPSVDGRR